MGVLEEMADEDSKTSFTQWPPVKFYHNFTAIQFNFILF